MRDRNVESSLLLQTTTNEASAVTKQV